MKKRKTQFQMKLESLGFKTYSAYLKSDHWQEFRTAYFLKHKKVCFCCAQPARDLHHVDYSHLGSERQKDVTPVCSICHEVIHFLMKRYKVLLSESHKVVKKVRKIK